MKFVKKVTKHQLFLPLFSMVLVMLVNIIYDVANGNAVFNFFTISINNGILYGRLIDILNRGSEAAILALGMTLVVSSSAGTDISVGSVMSLAGVSIATVSRVINGSDRVSPRTRQKVLRVIEENGYTPNAFARGLGLNTMHTIGLLCADAADPYLAQAVNDLERRLRQSGYDSLLCCTGYEQETKEKYLSLLLSKRVDGLVLVGSHFVESEEAGNAYIRRAAQEVPVMLLGGALAGQNLYAVRCDERAAMRGAVRRLLASGRQNVLYLYNSMSFSGRNKLAGYREGYADAGRSAPEGLALMLDAYRFDVAQVRELLARKWDAGARFDAVLAADDRLAVGAAKFAKLRGLRIPQDLSIIGCNNSPIARYCDPELTSIDNRLGDLCAACVDGLMAVLEGKPCPADAALPAALVERESTDLPKEE